MPPIILHIEYNCPPRSIKEIPSKHRVKSWVFCPFGFEEFEFAFEEFCCAVKAVPLLGPVDLWSHFTWYLISTNGSVLLKGCLVCRSKPLKGHSLTNIFARFMAHPRRNLTNSVISATSKAGSSCPGKTVAFNKRCSLQTLSFARWAWCLYACHDGHRNSTFMRLCFTTILQKKSKSCCCQASFLSLFLSTARTS